MTMDATDWHIIAATPIGLGLPPAPCAEVAGWLGMVANGMSVWDVADAQAMGLGAKVGALRFVSHCYLRPRALPDWPYNLFAMIRGTSRDQVEGLRGEIAALLGAACAGRDILYSTRI